MFVMLFRVFFSLNIIVLDFCVFKVSLFLSKQFSIFLSSILTNFCNEVESSPEARSAVSPAKRRVFKFETLGISFTLCIEEINRQRTLPCGTP